MTTAPARRRGFTLVELLVVVALLAVLAAISAGAFFRVQAAERVRATEATLSKLQTGINRKWSAVLDTAKDTIPAEIVTFAGGDKDRARVIWTYMRLKNEFPTTFQEARNSVTIPGYYELKPRSVFVQPLLIDKSLPDLPLPQTPEDAAKQSAACLYLTLTATASRGEAMDLDGLNQQTGTVTFPGAVPDSLPVFVDAWGKPIAFFRMAFPNEVQGPPYTRAGAKFMDPCDPLGKLVTAGGTWSPNTLATFWTVITRNHVGVVPPLPGGPPATYQFPPAGAIQNWVATTISIGPDEEWSNFFDGDNLVGYRIRREGAQGN